MPHVEIDPAIFNPIYFKYLKDETPIQIFFGGASSGKSKFICQRIVFDILKGKRNYLVCREVARTLRGSVVQEIVKIIKEWEVESLFSINKTDNTITCSNGYQIVFVGLDDVEKIKSITPAKGVFTDAFCEEATETDKASIAQILKRQRGGSDEIPKRITMSFNPILQSHWLYTDYFKNLVWNGRAYMDDEISILKTTYKDNRFLTKQDITRLENEKDKYRYDVYTLGNWGVLGNVIFTNWEVRDLTDMRDQFTNHRNGLDFGFSADPAALVHTHFDKMRKTIYVYDELYQTGLTNDRLADEAFSLVGSQVITCDSAEPKSVAELARYELSTRSAVKGKDSVLHGIQWLQQHSIIIDTKCINFRNEIQGYKWKEDKGGVALPVPVDTDNHLIDALRYAYESDMASNWIMS
jgi:phage terminase large subunit